MTSAENVAIFAPLPAIARGEAYVLGADPKGKNFLYTSTNGVIIRDIKNPKNCDVYAGHSVKVTTAQYSPSGFYICSGDRSGKIRIWDTVNKEHALSKEYTPIAGPILDIAWGPENKRIAICGQGRQRHGAAILMETGTNVGEITQVSKKASTVSYKPTRPFRLAFGDDGHEVGVYEGPPFKYKKSLKEHTRFLNSVRYSPDGSYLATASSDYRVFLYNAKDSELIGQFGSDEKPAHSGGVYSISWKPDSKELLTVSADKSAKIWDVETRQELVHFVLGSEIEYQQNASLWMGDYILSVSVSGNINYLDRNNPSKPSRVLHGHSVAINSIVVIPGETQTHFTGDASGKILKWDTASGDAEEFIGKGHQSMIASLAYDSDKKQLISAGWDDELRYTSICNLDYSTSERVPLGSQPKSFCLADDGYVVVNSAKATILCKDKKKVFELAHGEFCPSALAAHGKTVAIMHKRNKVRIYNIESDSLVYTNMSFGVSSGVQVMQFSPDGSKLAIATGSNQIHVHKVSSDYELSKELLGHHARILCLEWSPSGRRLASGAMDGNLMFWNVSKKDSVVVQAAHGKGCVSDIAWLDNNSALTVADDCSTRQWAVVW